MKKIPFCKPSITWREKFAVLDVLGSGNLTQGSLVQDFENSFADYVGSKYAIAVGSGTDALFLSLSALRVGPGDAVIVPSLTFTASASVILHRGAEIIFADVSPKDFCIDWEEVRVLIGMKSNVKAVIAVDLTGNDAGKDMAVGVPVIIDSAHRVERGCHQFGQIRTYSFHGTKNMTTGFGGMVTTDDEEVAKYIRLARMHGCFKAGWDKGEMNNVTKRYGYEVMFPGWKMNMNNIQAALGIEQLDRLDWINKQRQRCVERYNYGLRFELSVFRYGLHLYPIFVNERGKFLEKMEQAGIECSIHFKPLHTMEAYKDVTLHRPLKVTEYLGKHIVSLPLYPDLTNKQIDYICKKVNETYLLLSL